LALTLTRNIIWLLPSVSQSVSTPSLNRLMFCMYVGHYHGSQGIETEGRRSRSIKMWSVWPWCLIQDSFYARQHICY